MNFEEFKKVIEEIKSDIPCRDCGSAFNDSDIRIIGSVLTETYIIARCHACSNTTIINVVATPHRKHRKLKQSPKVITQNDILDMQNFLKDFDGDFSRLFNNKS